MALLSPRSALAGPLLLLLKTLVHGESNVPTFQVPPGFVVEKVAGPPLVRYPLFGALDDQGRLYVAEGTGTNLAGEELAKKKLGRIVVLEDTDGDGKFDTSKVFADGLVFPQGVLWHDGSVYTASHPSFWRLDGPEGQGAATRRTELATGFRFNGNGCDIHGPFLGPDGWLYWTDGRHGYKVTTREGAVLEGLASRIWRCRPDGSGLERICGGGFDNPVEIAFTPDGEAIGTMDQGPGDCLLHYVEGGVYPMEHPCLTELVRTGPLLPPVRQYSPVLPAALCGLTSYRSDHFGPAYRDCLFSTHYMTHKIVQHILVRDGSTFRAEDRDFLATMSHDVRLTDVLEGGDGSLLFVDMGAWFTYGFPGNPLAKPAAFGAIYRIRRSGAPRVADPWGRSLRLAARSPSELGALLDDPRPKVRDQVIHLLGKQGPAAVGALEKVLGNRAASVESQRNAVWALCRMRAPAAQAVLRQALGDKDASVRLAAIHSLGLERNPEALPGLCRLMESDELPVRRKAAEALGRLGRSQAVPALMVGLRKGGDRFLEHAVIYALIQINDREAVLPALGDNNRRVQQAALVALDQMKDGGLTEKLVAPLLEMDDPALQRAVLQVLSHRPAWSVLVKEALGKWLRRPRLSEADEKALTEALPALAATVAGQEVVAESLASSRAPTATKVLLLSAVARASVEPFPMRWHNAIEMALDSGDERVLGEAITMIHLLKFARFDHQLGELGTDRSLSLDLRVAALECAAGHYRKLAPPAFAFLTEQLSQTTPPLRRLAAARALGSANLSAEQLQELAGPMKTVNNIVLRALLQAFARKREPGIGRTLVDALQGSPAAEALSVAELDRALGPFGEDVRKRARGLRDKLAERQKGQAAYLARLTAELSHLKGDADAGQEVFLSQKMGCYGCHRAVGRGGDVGPDLSRIGQFRTPAELLESIVFPSSTIAPEYRAFQATLRDGRVIVGLIIREAPGAIHFRTTDLSEVRVRRKDIDDMTPSNVSLMPEGLEKSMTRQELRDLLEFLSRQRGGP
jgi:putative heme-binding domain-containing protein